MASRTRKPAIPAKKTPKRLPPVLETVLFMAAGAYVYQVGVWAFRGVLESRDRRPQLILPPLPIDDGQEQRDLDEARAERLRLELNAARRRAESAESATASEQAALADARRELARAERSAAAVRAAPIRIIRPRPNQAPQQTNTKLPDKKPSEPDDDGKSDRFAMLEMDE